MKRFGFALLIICGALLLAASLLQTSASAAPALDLPTNTAVNATPPAAYIIYLPLPDLQTANLPANLPRERAATYAAALLTKNAQPVLDQLAGLQRQGLIAGFEFLIEQNAVQITGADPARLRSQVQLPAETMLSQVGLDPACTSRPLELLQNQLLARQAADRAHAARPQGLQATDPSIDVYYTEGWSAIEGLTTPDTTVNVRILRGSVLVAASTTTSYGNGRYNFYPEWAGTCWEDYTWELRPGDIVEVSAHGSTYSTEVVDITAWGNPFNNSVAGQTAPGRLVEVSLYHYDDGWCYGDSFSASAPTDAAGSFAVDFSSQVDFDGLDSGNIYARDANGNSTYTYFNTFHITVDAGQDYFDAVIQPDSPFTATLERAAVTISTDTGDSGASGWASGWFTTTIQAGDIIHVQSQGLSLSMTVPPLSAALNTASDQVTGLTGPGWLVTAYPENRYCPYDYACVSAAADGGGSFAIPAGFDLVNGDYVYLYAIDSLGNYVYDGFYMPIIEARPASDNVRGSWSPDTSLTIRLYDSSHNLKETGYEWSDAWDGYYSYYFSNDTLAGDQIEVGDGLVTATMTIQNLSSVLNNATEHLSGAAPNGFLRAEYWDYHQQDGYWYDSCLTTNVSGSAYDFDLTASQVGAQDYAYVSTLGADGHYTTAYANAFEANLNMNYAYVWGYTLAPTTTVNAQVWDGATLLYTATTTSYDDGYYYAYFSGPPSAGQRLVVDADLDTDYVIPSLTIARPGRQRGYRHRPGQPGARWPYVDYACGKGSCVLAQLLYDHRCQRQLQRFLRGRYFSAYDPTVVSPTMSQMPAPSLTCTIITKANTDPPGCA
jgi:hypothetical protein